MHNAEWPVILEIEILGMFRFQDF